MTFEAKFSTVPEGIKVTTTRNEEDIYPDILAASRKIGREKIWGRLENYLGTVGATLGIAGGFYDAAYSQQTSISVLALAALSTVASVCVVIHGMNKENEAIIKYEALRESSQIVAPV